MEQRSTATGLNAADAFGPSTADAIKQMLCMVWRRKALLVLGLLLTYGLGALYYYSKDRVYEARASILVHQTGDTPSGKAADLADNRQNYLPTHVRLIGSAAVLTKAVERFKDGHASVAAGLDADNMARGLKITSVKDTDILEIAYRTNEPALAAPVVDAVVASYLAFVNDTHHSTAKDVLQVLTQQKEVLDQQLHEREAELASLRQAAGLYTLRDDKGNVTDARVLALNQALTQARVKRLEAAARLQAAQADIAHGQSVEAYVVRYLDRLAPEIAAERFGLNRARSTAPALPSPGQAQLEQAQLEMQRLQVTYGPNHPRVRLLREQIELTSRSQTQGRDDSDQRNRQDAAEKARTEKDLQAMVLHVLESDVNEAQDLETQLLNQFDHEKEQALALNARNAPLAAAESEVNRLRAFDDTINTRIKQVHLGEDYGAISAQVIEPPQQPLWPVSPDLPRVAMTCTGLGLLVMLGLCCLLEWWDAGFRGPEDVTFQLGLPVLGHIPWMRRAGKRKPFELVVSHAAQSIEADAFRTLRSALLLCDSPPKKLAITSPDPGDGKTSIVTNLAIAFSQSGLRTLVIDSDLRRPRLHEIFQLPASPGLAHLLRQENPEEHVADQIHTTAIERLDVLPSGPTPANPTELLTGARFSRLIAWAETYYDRVLCDAPPILAVSDCAVLGRALDGALVVVRADRSDRVAATRACDSLRRMNCPVLGVIVMNGRSTTGYAYGYARKSGYYAASVAEQPEEQSRHTSSAPQTVRPAVEASLSQRRERV